MERYSRNYKTITLGEQEKLKRGRVCAIGCGGLGGYIIEMLGRIGVGFITAVDNDVFEESNLNRQILSSSSSLGKSKALEAKARMAVVNPQVTITPLEEYFTKDNANKILANHDVIVDALDNIQGRLTLQAAAESLNIPVVHGAIAGWYGQVTTILPGDRTLDKLYKTEANKGIEKQLGNPSFTPALVASIQVSEVVKRLIGRGELLSNKLLIINLLDQEYEILEIN